MRLPLAWLLPLTLTTSAGAETLLAARDLPPEAEVEAEPGLFADTDFYTTVAFSGGAMHLGPYEFGGAGIRAELGIDFGRFHIVGDQALMYFASPTDGQDGSGLFARTGVQVRVPLGRWTFEDGSVNGYVEAGPGIQRLPAHRTINRVDFGVGWIAEVQTKWFGTVIGGRFLAAPERERDAFFALSGQPKRNRLDVGVLATLGGRFGGRLRYPGDKKISFAAQGEPGDSVGFEYGLGVRNIRDTNYFTGAVAVRRLRRFGRFALGGEGSVSLISHHDREKSEVRDDGLMARVGGVAKYSVWRPKTKILTGDFFVDGGAGYAVGSLSSGRFHEFDVTAGGGVGYDIFEPDAISPAKTFSAYVAMRAVAPVDDVSRIGGLFSVGLQWLR